MEISKLEFDGNIMSQLSADARNTTDNASFDEHLFNELNHVNEKITTAENNIKDLALGNSANLHEVMLSIQRAKLSLEMLMKVRDKTLEGLQEILRMQI